MGVARGGARSARPCGNPSAMTDAGDGGSFPRGRSLPLECSGRRAQRGAAPARRSRRLTRYGDGMADREKPQVTVPSDQAPSYQLEVEDLIDGDGDEAVDGHVVEVHYVGVSWKTGSSSTPPGTAARRSSSVSARAR